MENKKQQVNSDGTKGYSSKSMLVDFMVIGAQKCGTTTLAAQLASHTDVCFCQEKEPGFFNTQEDWFEKLDDYHALYTPKEGQICGEASTMYTFFPEYLDTPERLYAYNPNLKLIYVMRDPIERVASLYAHNVVRNIEKKPPAEAVLQDPSYVNRSRYGMQLRPYIKLFGRDQILPIIFEEYITDQANTLEQVAAFLGISSDGFGNDEESHNHKTVGTPYLKYEFVRQITSSNLFQSYRLYFPEKLRFALRGLVSNTLNEKPEFPMALRETLYRLLFDDIASVEDLLGRSVKAWQTEFRIS